MEKYFLRINRIPENQLLKNELVKKGFNYIKKDDENTLKEQLEMCEIPAPSHQEKQKAEYAQPAIEKKRDRICFIKKL